MRLARPYRTCFLDESVPRVAARCHIRQRIRRISDSPPCLHPGLNWLVPSGLFHQLDSAPFDQTKCVGSANESVLYRLISKAPGDCSRLLNIEENSRARTSVVPNCGNRKALAYPRDLTGLDRPAHVVVIRSPMVIPNDAGFPSLTGGCSIGTLQYGVQHFMLLSHINYLE